MANYLDYIRGNIILKHIRGNIMKDANNEVDFQKGLKRYNRNSKCDKCGNSQRNATLYCNQDNIEFLTRTCSVCGYSWFEYCIDKVI